MEKIIGIKVKGISKSFGAEKVLSDINLNVDSGKIIGVVGNNGSGKTVLMKCICGFLKPDSGTIIVNGEAVGKDCDFPSSLGIIIETPGFIPDISGYGNLKNLAALKRKIGKDRILECIETVGLTQAKNKAVSKYSLGMRQRLGIAQAIMEDPDVLILDEPFNGLDRSTAEQIRGLLKDQKSRGKAILLASHNSADISELCDDVLEMDVYRRQ